MGVFSANKREMRKKIDSLNGMYAFVEEINATAHRYLSEKQ